MRAGETLMALRSQAVRADHLVAVLPHEMERILQRRRLNWSRKNSVSARSASGMRGKFGAVLLTRAALFALVIRI
jgi:hypothetical protein